MEPRSEGEQVVGSRLLERAQSGDAAAFVALLHRYDRELRSLVFRLIGDRKQMDDVMQEAYLRAFRALPRFRGEAAVGTWLYRITYNACVDELRRSRRWRRLAPRPLTEVEDVASAEADLGDAVADRRAVRAALMALSPEERAAVWMVDGEGLDYRVAAAALGVAEGTIASRLHRARRVLHLALADQLEAAEGS